MAVEYTCDVASCGEDIDSDDVIFITVARRGEQTVSHTHTSCFDQLLKASDDVESILLHD